MNQVDILLGTYNGESFLSEQINSIINQNHTDWKLIIHDDNSTDNTVSIIHQYVEDYPNKIIFLNDNISFGNALENFSYLLEHTKASYIMFCDQDDVWLPNKIEITLVKIKETKKEFPDMPVLVHTDLKVVNSDLNILSDSYWSYQGIDPDYDTLNRLLVQNVITGCTVMINKKLADMALPIPKGAIMHDWWLGLVASSVGKIVYIDTATMLYRQHANNDTGATRFNLSAILKQWKNLSYIDLKKYTVQAEELLSKYEENLNDEQKELLKAFISTDKQSWIQSKQTLLKYKILKQGIFRNIGLLLCR